MKPALFCQPLRPVLTRVREEYESQGVEAYAYLDDITIVSHEISPGTVGVVPFLERELTARAINLNSTNKVALAPKGHVPAPEETLRLAGEVGVRIAGEGGIKVIWVPVGTDEFAIESTMGIVRDGGAEQLARMLPRMTDKQTASLIAIGSTVQRMAYVERVMDQKLSLPACRRADKAQCGCSKTSSSFLERRSDRRSSRRGAWKNGLHCYPTNGCRLACQQGPGVRNVVGRSEKGVRIGGELGGNAACSPG